MNIKKHRQYINTLEEILEEVREIKQKIPKELKKDLEYIGRSVVTLWYDSYDDRKIYDPYGSLYDAFKVEVDEDHFLVDFDVSYMEEYEHHQENSIIFNNAFMGGYHGGSTGEGLNSTTPHWRTPYPFYPRWGSPAKKSFSPYEEMVKLMNKRIKTTQDYLKRREQNMIARLKPYL